MSVGESLPEEAMLDEGAATMKWTVIRACRAAEAGTAFALTVTTSWVAGTVDEEEKFDVVRYALPASIPAEDEGKLTALKKLHIQQLEIFDLSLIYLLINQ